MRHSRYAIPGLVSALALAASQGLAGPEYTTGSGGTFNYYGQLNFAFTSFDDGDETTSQLADNEASNSRVGFWIRQPFGENELAFRFETALGFAPSDEFSQTSEPDDFEWTRTNLRHVDFIYTTARYGTFYIGQGSMASDGVGNNDASGTGLGAAVSVGDAAGGFQFRDSAGALTGIEIGDAFADFDGTRAGRIRYDTPDFNGFTVSVAAGENILSENNDDEFYDIALKYEGEFGGTEVEAGLGYQVRERPGSQDREDTFGSVGVKLPSGLNFSLAAGERNTSGSYVYVKAGYAADWLSVGETALSIDFFSGQDMVSDGDESESIGIAVVQDFDDQNIEAYLGYRHYSYSDTTATSFEDASSVIIGARWRF